MRPKKCRNCQRAARYRCGNCSFSECGNHFNTERDICTDCVRAVDNDTYNDREEEFEG